MPEVDISPDDVSALLAQVAQLQAVVAEQAVRLERQAATIEQQAERIRELQVRLAKNSRNSSKPPSSDPPFNKPPPRSQRTSSGRKRGGQKGHRGATRPLSEDVDHRVIAGLTGSCRCGRAWADADIEVLPERRQVIELVVRREITEHRIVQGNSIRLRPIQVRGRRESNSHPFGALCSPAHRPSQSFWVSLGRVAGDLLLTPGDHQGPGAPT